MSNSFGVEHCSSATFLRVPGSSDHSDTAAVRQHYSLIGTEAMLAAAEHCKIAPFVAHYFMSLGLDASYWGGSHAAFAAASEAKVRVLCELNAKLRDGGQVRPLLVENMASLLVSEACRGCFSSSDVDLWIEQEHYEGLEQALRSLGATEDRVKGHRERSIMVSHRLDLADDARMWINVMFRPVARRALPRAEVLDARFRYFRDEETTDVANGILTLKPEALMYACMLHIAFGHYFTIEPGLRLYVDIDRLARAQTIDWDKVYHWAELDGTLLPVALAGEIANDGLGSGIPRVRLTAGHNARLRLLRSMLVAEELHTDNQHGYLWKAFVDLVSSGLSASCSVGGPSKGG